MPSASNYMDSGASLPEEDPQEAVQASLPPAANASIQPGAPPPPPAPVASEPLASYQPSDAPNMSVSPPASFVPAPTRPAAPPPTPTWGGNAPGGAPALLPPSVAASKGAPAHDQALVNPRTQQKIADSYTHTQGALGEQEDSAWEKAQAEQHEAKARQDAARAEQQATLKRIDEGKISEAAGREKVLKLSEELARMQVDPDRYDKNLSPAQKFAATLAAAFSGFSAGWNHQSGNAALEAQAQSRAADVDAQKANIANTRARVGDYRQMLADLDSSREADERLYEKASAQGDKAITAQGQAEGAPASLRGQLAALHAQEAATDRESAETSAKMNRYMPAMASGHPQWTQADRDEWAKLAGDLQKSNPTWTTEQAESVATARVAHKYGVNVRGPNLTGYIKGSAKPGVVSPLAGLYNPASSPDEPSHAPTSTRLPLGIPDPRGWFHGTDVHQAQEYQRRWDGALMQAIGESGVSPRMAKDVFESLKTEGASEEDTKHRVEEAQRRFGGMLKGGTSPTAGEEEAEP